MATYKIDSSLLTAQADEIRELNGTTATMNPSQMTTALQSANAEVAAQEQKIIEITEMLQGKAMGGSSSGGSSGACTVRLYSNGYQVGLIGYGIMKSTGETEGESAVNGYDYDFDTTFSDVLCGSLVAIRTECAWGAVLNVTGNAEIVAESSEWGFWVVHITASAGEAVTLTFTSDY